MKIDFKSEFLTKISKINPELGNFNPFIESLLSNLNRCYPKISFEIQIFNPRKKNFKSYSVINNKVDFKVIPSGSDLTGELIDIFPDEIEVNKNAKRQFPLIKDNLRIGCIEAVGVFECEHINFDLIIAAQFVVRALLSNEKKMAIDSLVELNTELEKIVHEKTDSLLKEKEAHFNASKMATLGEVAAGVAHEINNPLTIIQTRVLTMEKMMEKKKVLDPEISEEFKKIIATVQRITKIIKGLKFMTRDGRHDPPSRVILSDLFQTTLDLCLDRLKSNGVDLAFTNLIDDFEIEVRETQIVQVFLNLINNAFDAIKSQDNKWIKINCQATNNLLKISFTDSGLGISEEVSEKIMNPFFTTKPVGQGTGLGLSISKGIIESHLGRLFYNNKSPNTEFVIELPFIKKLKATPKIA